MATYLLLTIVCGIVNANLFKRNFNTELGSDFLSGEHINFYSKALNANIFMYQHGSKLLIEVSDDGSGFNYQKELHHPRGLGLKKIFQRVQMLGGKIDVLSTQKIGTKFSIEIPLK